MEKVLYVEKLSKSYAGKPAVEGLCLSVNKGEVFGLLGPNGAGKSTTIECVLGTRPRDAGDVVILGMDPVADRKTLFERVGVQFQESNYQEKITVSELCEVTASLYRNPADYEALLRCFGLAEKKKAPVAELSGGEKQRLFVVLALLPSPELVFLDELTTGLDTNARREVWKLLKDWKKEGLTVFMTSHYMDEVETLCDKIAILKEGRIIFTGTVEEAIGASPCDRLEEAYLWFTDAEVTEDACI